MFHILAPLRGVMRSPSVSIDNTVFRLHYRVTVTALVAASLLITARQYFGDPINCMEQVGIPPTVLDTYCWIHGTFSDEAAWKKTVGREVAYPGVDRTSSSSSSRTYHSYYQWVWAVLFLQAIAFYLPHFLWKSLEGGLTKNLTLDLKKSILKEEEKTEQLNLLVEYLHRAREMNIHRRLPAGYLLCELLNVLNVALQVTALDQVLGGKFFSYGWTVLQFSLEHLGQKFWPMSFEPMLQVFPRVSKCEYFQFGASGEVVSLDTICLLPVNIFNEKVFLLFWYWLLLLMVLTTGSFLYNIFTSLLLPTFKATFYLPHKTSTAKTAVDRTYGSSVGDAFVLALLAKNLAPMHYHDLLVKLEDSMACKEKNV